jgi:hypothetical protein
MPRIGYGRCGAFSKPQKENRMTRYRVRFLLFCLLLGPALLFALTDLGKAHADPITMSTTEVTWIQQNGQDVCRKFESNPTLKGLESITTWVLSSGFSTDEAASVMWVSINAVCPNDLPQIHLILDKASGKVTGV